MGTLRVEPGNGETLLNLLRRSERHLPAPCGGAGTCGKCKIRVVKGDAGPLDEAEKRMLGRRELENGVRLACRAEPMEPVEIEESSTSLNSLDKGAWEESFPTFKGKNDSWLRKSRVCLRKSDLEDQGSELLRLSEVVNLRNTRLTPRLLDRLAGALKQGKREVTLVEEYTQSEAQDTELLDVEAGDTTDRMFGCAVDIGTTTVAVYVADLGSAVPFDSLARSNRQGAYGADVISRIGYVIENGIEEVREAVREQIRGMISVLAERNGVALREIYRIVFVGNTTMMHMLLGVDPSGIAAAPFVPVFTEEMVIDASSLELELHPSAKAHIVPGVSSYVGADITAGLLSVEIFKRKGVCLFMDVGTNGEIVLKHDDVLWACSAAAGPAFEGANIRWGTGGKDGAVDSFSVKEGMCTYTTIGREPAVGICGAGLVDVLSILLRYGMIDEKGRLLKPVELESSELDERTKSLFTSRMTEVEGKSAFIVVPASETAVGEDIILLHRDVRDVQLAKGAVAGGFYTLLDHAGINATDIEHLYLAGGFGSYVKRESAGEIGLIPKELVDVTCVAGNAAGRGALYTLFSRERSTQYKRIVGNSKYIELSTSPVFQKYFMREMYF